MTRDDRWLDAMEARWEALCASSTCCQCAHAEVAEADREQCRADAERFMRLLVPAPGVSRERSSFVWELAVMLAAQAEGVAWCDAMRCLVAADAPCGGCGSFSPVEWE